MKLPFYLVDAFTTTQAFSGNPAAVVPLQRWLPDALMQAMASEHNQAETAFFVPQDGGYGLRWFTPTLEVDFCGHATLASAWVLWQELGVEASELRFDTKAVGALRVRQHQESGHGLLELDLPAFQPERVDAAPQALMDGLGLGVEGWESWRNFENYYVLLPTEAALRAVAPNMAALQALHPLSVCVTAPAGKSKANDPDLDFVSRYFAPSYGIPEDPVTGSVHATLAPLWARRLGKTRLRARQLSARGGALDCECVGQRVLVRGQARTYLRGTLELGDAP